MISTLLTLVIGFFLGEGIGYAIHRFLHSSLSGRAHIAHMTHHLKLYPPTNFYSEKYRSPGKDNTVFIFGVILVALCTGMWFVLPHRIAIILMVEFLVLGLANDYLHDIFHIKPNWLEKYDWFQRLRAIHLVHHQDMSKNYGIFTFLGDRLFGTLKK